MCLSRDGEQGGSGSLCLRFSEVWEACTHGGKFWGSREVLFVFIFVFFLPFSEPGLEEFEVLCGLTWEGVFLWILAFASLHQVGFFAYGMGEHG